MCTNISVSDNNERNVQSGQEMRTLYTATYMTFSLLEKKNTVKLYSINKVNKVFKLILMQKMICLSLEIIFSQLVLKYILISYLHIIYNVIIFSCM